MKITKILIQTFLLLAAYAAQAQTNNAKFTEALNLVQNFSGAGNELVKAEKIALDLAKTRPNSGMSETIQAELLIAIDGQSEGIAPQRYERVIALTDKAIALDGALAPAYLTRARARVKAENFSEASADIALALAREAENASAYFLLADIKRRTGEFAAAIEGYRKFIALTPAPVRKSNGYYWLYDTYMDWSRKEPMRRQELIAKAGECSKLSVDLDPKSAWKNVNYAVFLNGRTGNFVEARKYAENALKAMNFPMGRMQLAAALYQQLGVDAVALGKKSVDSEQKTIAKMTGLTLAQAIDEFDPKTNIGSRLIRVKTILDAL